MQHNHNSAWRALPSRRPQRATISAVHARYLNDASSLCLPPGGDPVCTSHRSGVARDPINGPAMMRSRTARPDRASLRRLTSAVTGATQVTSDSAAPGHLLFRPSLHPCENVRRSGGPASPAWKHATAASSTPPARSSSVPCTSSRRSAASSRKQAGSSGKTDTGPTSVPLTKGRLPPRYHPEDATLDHPENGSLPIRHPYPRHMRRCWRSAGNPVLHVAVGLRRNSSQAGRLTDSFSAPAWRLRPGGR